MAENSPHLAEYDQSDRGKGDRSSTEFWLTAFVSLMAQTQLPQHFDCDTSLPNNMFSVPEFLERASIAAEAEAIALGYPAKAGVVMLWGQINDDIQDWDKDRFLKWAHHTDRLYGRNTMDLYKVVGQVFQRFPIPVVPDSKT